MVFCSWQLWGSIMHYLASMLLKQLKQTWVNKIDYFQSKSRTILRFVVNQCMRLAVKFYVFWMYNAFILVYK